MQVDQPLDGRGVALPMAMLGLALLTSLMLALAALWVSEPVIAAGQLRASQARALADSGVQYALGVLSRPGAGAPFTSPAFVRLGATGGFSVEVGAHASGDPQLRTITAVGWAPAPGLGEGRAHRQVVAEAVSVPRPAARAPCALCVRGALEVAGNVAVDGTNRDAACGADDRFGTFSGDATTVTGPASLTGGAGGSASHQPAAAFDAVTLSPATLAALRALAMRRGTYYGPGFPAGGTVADGSTTWAGRLVFDPGRRLPDGVVFVDTTDGRDVAPGGGGVTLATLRLEPGAVEAPDGVFRGWLIVNGALEIAGGTRLRGLVYAVGPIAHRGTGSSRLEGLAVAQGAGGMPTRLETGPGGGLVVTFDCAGAGGDGLVPRGWVLRPGTYREERD